MVDVTSSTTAAPATSSGAGAPASATFGSTIDAEIVLLKSRIASIESAGKTDWAKLVAGAKRNWAHFVTWAALAGTNPLTLDLLRRVL
jgi:hypothetical protein